MNLMGPSLTVSNGVSARSLNRISNFVFGKAILTVEGNSGSASGVVVGPPFLYLGLAVLGPPFLTTVFFLDIAFDLGVVFVLGAALFFVLAFLAGNKL